MYKLTHNPLWLYYTQYGFIRNDVIFFSTQALFGRFLIFQNKSTISYETLLTVMMAFTKLCIQF